MTAQRRATPADILVAWAYDNLQCIETSCAGSSMWERVGYGHDSGRRGSGAQRYAVLGSPDPNAEAVDRAVAALPDAAIDWERHLPSIMGDLAALLPLADAPRERIRTSVLVRSCGILGRPPAWEGRPRPHRTQPARGPAGGAAVVGECHGRDRYSPGAHCPIRWEPAPAEIARRRATYVAWWDGLIRLSEALDGQLRGVTVLPPSAPAAPWASSVAPRRVLRAAAA
jgi:hypothetical protein